MPNKIPIHAASINGGGPKKRYLLLKEEEEGYYRWFSMSGEATPVAADNIHESIRLARNHWSQENIQMLACGFRYTLPERDEHGMNALFFQMAASCSQMNGIYFDEELGHNCYVQNASQEALDLWKELCHEQPQ